MKRFLLTLVLCLALLCSCGAEGFSFNFGPAVTPAAEEVDPALLRVAVEDQYDADNPESPTLRVYYIYEDNGLCRRKNYKADNEFVKIEEMLYDDLGRCTNYSCIAPVSGDTWECVSSEYFEFDEHNNYLTEIISKATSKIEFEPNSDGFKHDFVFEHDHAEYYGYDADGNMTEHIRVTPNGDTFELPTEENIEEGVFEYDDQGRTIRQTCADGSETTYTYDKYGNLIRTHLPSSARR